MNETISSVLGQILAYGGGGAAAAYLIFKYLGEKWIENKFSERLQEVRYKIDVLFNRVTKIHEKEFEVLPEAWIKLQDALGLISKITNLFQQYPDLHKLHEEELIEYLTKTKLTEFQKKKLLSESDKNKYYMDVIFWHDLHEAEQGLQEFHNYIIRNRIFLSPDLQDRFNKIDDIMWKAFIERRMSEEAKDHKMRHEAYKKIRDDVAPIRDEIENIVQKRLRYQDAE